MLRLLALCLVVQDGASIKQNHYVRGKVQRVTIGAAIKGGPEDDSRSSTTPRISGDGEYVVFYSDSNLTSGFEPADNAYQIYRANVAPGTSPPFEMMNIVNHESHDFKGPVINGDGSAVVYANAGTDEVFYWSTTETTPRKIAENAYDSTGDMAISADGKWATYEAKSVYDVMLISTADGATATVVNSLTGSGERASDAAISGKGEFVAYVSNKPTSTTKHEVWVYDRAGEQTHQVTDTLNLFQCHATAEKATLHGHLQAHWGAANDQASLCAGMPDPYDTTCYLLTEQGLTTSSTLKTSCEFLAANGIIASKNNIEPMWPSVSDDGRYVTWVADFDASTITRPVDDAAAVSPTVTHEIFLYDRVLGITSRLFEYSPTDVGGQSTCCDDIDDVAGCSHKDFLAGKCCYQRPCRIGAVNIEISGDGKVVAFNSEVAFGGSPGNGQPDGNLGYFIHHIPTAKTHRITHTFDKDWDQTFPDINYDGSVLVWESKSHFGEDITIGGDNDGNKEVWMTRLKYGCDDPTATNYEPEADVAECCTYADATKTDGDTKIMSLVLGVDLAAALTRTVATTEEASCVAWGTTVLADLACALHVPSNVLTTTATSCTALAAAADNSAITVDVTLHPTAATSADALSTALLSQLQDATARVWAGHATRYVLKAKEGDVVKYSRDSSDSENDYARGTVSSITAFTVAYNDTLTTQASEKTRQGAMTACAADDASTRVLQASIQAFWGTDEPIYNLTANGISTTSDTCAFAAASNLQSGVSTSGVTGVTIGGSDRFEVYMSDYQMGTAFGTHDQHYPVTEVNAFLHDKQLGLTTRVTVPPTFSAVVGAASCCITAAASKKAGSCTFIDRLKGTCCDQKPCRIGAADARISTDGQRIVFTSDVNYDAAGPKLVQGEKETWVHDVRTATSHRVTYMHDGSMSAVAISADGTEITFEITFETSAAFKKTVLTYGCDDPRAYNYAAAADIDECCKYSDDATVIPYDAERTRVPIILKPFDFARTAASHVTANLEKTGTELATYCETWQKDVLADLSCALRVPANRIQIEDPSSCKNNAGEVTVTVDFLPAGATQDTPTQLANKLLAQIKDAGSPIWKGYATRYIKHDMAWNGLYATTASVSAPPPSPPPTPMSPAPEGQKVVEVHYVEVKLIAAGNVADYDDTKKTAIATAFATEVGVNVTDVTVTVTAASVIIDVEIKVGTGASGASAASTLVSDLQSTVLKDSAAAGTFLSAASMTVQAVEVKAVTKIEYVADPPVEAEANMGLGGGALAGIAVGAILGVILIVLLVYFMKKKKETKGTKGTTSNAGVDSVAA